MSYSPWKYIETQADLDALRDAYAWDEAELMEFYGCRTNESYFPKEISRSGGPNVNVHMLVFNYRHEESDPDFVELVMIDCDLLGLNYMSCPRFKGRVDSLKRVTIDAHGETNMRCARLIYRTIDDPDREEVNPYEVAYFKRSESLK